ncbi:AzlC family ABC transporter permease [Ilumatobacter nonamiensis]|uniref:AzlC family ABC transporter permease n=1 Tax=Ilumatobacter nonamiensis TaxID=467093 RepID=UPI000348FC40|nr:AzlC family ABC transporter permease [Ilumatobacter nonamiensis]
MTTTSELETGPQGRIDRQALADVVPLAIPAIPFGFVVGLAATESAMPQWIAWLTAPLVFAGAAQLAMITLAGTATLWAVITAVLVINTRHLMYSAALAPTFRSQPRWMRWFGPFFMVDQVFALASLQTHRSPAEFRRYFLTTALAFYAVWNAVVPLGMLVGPIVPDSWRLDYAPPIMFAGLTLFAIKRVPAAVAAIVGGFVSLATVDLQDRLGIVVGALAGVGAGAVAEWIIDRRSAPPADPAADPSSDEAVT